MNKDNEIRQKLRKCDIIPVVNPVDSKSRKGKGMAENNHWLRLWHEMPTDPKWRTIARVSKQSIGNVMSVYLHMLVCASTATERGRTQGWCDEDIATALDIETEQVIAIREAMQGRVLEGDYLTGWEKRQPKREDGSAERGKAWRERKKEEAEQQKTDANADERTRTHPNARREKKREEENNPPLPPEGDGSTPSEYELPNLTDPYEPPTPTGKRAASRSFASAPVRTEEDRSKELYAELSPFEREWLRSHHPGKGLPYYAKIIRDWIEFPDLRPSPPEKVVYYTGP